MFLAPDGDEIEITNAAAEFLGEAMPLDRLHTAGNADMSVALRAQLGNMGWFALALPETKGGSGLTAVEHALFFREVGRLCGPVDILAQSLAAHIADEHLRPAIVSGEQGVALVVKDGSRARLIGAADAVLALQVDQQGGCLFDIASTAFEERASLDIANSLRIGDLPQANRVAEVADDRLWQLGQLGTAAMQIGLAEVALELIVEYAKVRETFGRKIGSYQAVRHPCADMALRAEAARCQLWFAAAAIKEGRSDATVHLDAAKHLANQAALANADTNIQLHGGIGVTDEHHAHLLLKHSWLLGKLFGTKRALLARLLDARVES
ncbi:acyl-CoA dehydrogenase family protein [Sphingobium tyrosinilyticum]|uniref:Acyl-CoA dehydrogenase family protein n=1 Tax=Sphingobium tyrosinilyticum TaxID=2715436 RepID=A0ABV9F2G6_9SPHN